MSKFVNMAETKRDQVRSTVTLLAEFADIMTGLVLLSGLGQNKEIVANKVYTSTQGAKILGMKRLEVVMLAESGDIIAKRVDGNYRIIGQQMIDYLSDKPSSK